MMAHLAARSALLLLSRSSSGSKSSMLSPTRRKAVSLSGLFESDVMTSDLRLYLSAHQVFRHDLYLDSCCQGCRPPLTLQAYRPPASR